MSAVRCKLVTIGCSWGGLDVLRRILRGLPAELDAAVVVAQHRGPGSHPTAFRDLLGAATLLTVREAEDKDELQPGTVHVAAPDYHLLVDGHSLSLSTDEPVAYSRPSIDVLFETAAESYRDACLGIVLTGANADGAVCLQRIVELAGERVEHAAERLEPAPGSTHHDELVGHHRTFLYSFSWPSRTS